MLTKHETQTLEAITRKYRAKKPHKYSSSVPLQQFCTTPLSKSRQIRRGRYCLAMAMPYQLSSTIFMGRPEIGVPLVTDDGDGGEKRDGDGGDDGDEDGDEKRP